MENRSGRAGGQGGGLWPEGRETKARRGRRRVRPLRLCPHAWCTAPDRLPEAPSGASDDRHGIGLSVRPRGASEAPPDGRRRTDTSGTARRSAASVRASRTPTGAPRPCCGPGWPGPDSPGSARLPRPAGRAAPSAAAAPPSWSGVPPRTSGCLRETTLYLASGAIDGALRRKGRGDRARRYCREDYQPRPDERHEILRLRRQLGRDLRIGRGP